jgi:tetratricopeptide (TPR) repeat protein
VQKNQLLLIGSVLLLGIGLYFWGNTKAPKETEPTTTDNVSDGHQHDPMNPSSEIETIDFEKYTKEATNKLNSVDEALSKQLTQKAVEANTAMDYKNIAEFWEKQKDLNMAAFFYKKAAFLENTEKSVTFAGNLLMAVMQKTEQPSLKRWQALEAIDCFKRADSLNPNNADIKIALASCYTEGTGETMKGVTLLREVTQKDSNNVSANIILAKLAIQSGQLDKAITRLERVLNLKPDNTEAMYFLAEAYKAQGNKEKAISLFEKCKKIVNNPEFGQEIDNYIKTFK